MLRKTKNSMWACDNGQIKHETASVLPYVYKLWSILLNTDNTISKEYSSIFVVADTDSYGLVKRYKRQTLFSLFTKFHSIRNLDVQKLHQIIFYYT